MALARRVGFGMTARGSVADCVKWSERARAAGLESIWFHDSYFERDAITYASAVASQVSEIGIGLGAVAIAFMFRSPRRMPAGLPRPSVAH